MSWRFFRADPDNWKFQIVRLNEEMNQVVSIAELTLPWGGFHDTYGDFLAILSVGFNDRDQSRIKLYPDTNTVQLNGIRLGWGDTRYYVRVLNGANNSETELPDYILQLPRESFIELRRYVDSLHDYDDEENQLYPFEYEWEPALAHAPAHAPAPPAPAPAPAPEVAPIALAAEPLADERNFEYHVEPRVQNIIDVEEKLLTAVNNPENVVFKHGPSFFMYTKDNLRDLNDHSRIAFQCTQQLGGAPRRNQIHNRPYFNLPGPGMNFLIPYGQLLTLLDYPGFHTFELVQSGELANTTSYLAVIDDPAGGHGLDGQVVDLVGLDHCTAGTNKLAFAVHPLRISAIAAPAAQEGAGRRKTRRRQQRNRKNKSRRIKRRRSY